MLLRCPVDTLVGQAAVIHPRRVAVLLEMGVLHLGPPLSSFQEPFFRAGAVLSAAALFGMCPVVPLEVLREVALDPVQRPLRST